MKCIILLIDIKDKKLTMSKIFKKWELPGF